jgi:alkanesulfonate monooxygenase SsuD/methylene tetrahydromethanopterin reductase-like flavin-dependent oxidoreductase (luciferase family)
MREAVQILKALWTQERVEFEGEFFSLPPVHCHPLPARKGGPPVILGGMHPNVFRRIAAYGDGWLPAFITDETMAQGPEVVREGRRTLEELGARAGRDPGEFQICVILGAASRDLLRRYEDAGADRVAISMPRVGSESEACAALEAIATSVL